jgi:hypothetical protein
VAWFICHLSQNFTNFVRTKLKCAALKKTSPHEKRGPKNGSAVKTIRFNMRCDKGFIQDLDYLKNRPIHLGKSTSEILREIVQNAAFLATLYSS